MNLYAIYCTNYVNGCIYAAVPKAAEIKCAALHEMAVQAFWGEVVGSGVFRVIIKTV